MKANYFKYQEMTDELFYGVPLTDAHMNMASKKLWDYLLENGAQSVLKCLEIGFQVTKRESALFPEMNEIIKQRMVYTSGAHKGRELNITEMKNIGMFLKDGPCEHLIEKELNKNA